MKHSLHRRLLVGAFLGRAFVGCGEEPVPAKPTWVDDVQPILRGNCLNCHGVTASITKFRTKRWDVCSLDAFAAVGPFMEDPKAEFVGAAARLPVVFRSYLLPPADLPRPIMPPEPGPVLTDRQTQIIGKWIQNPICGTRPDNHKPAASWLDHPYTYVVDDADHDQVLGTITCGAVTDTILFAGAHALPAGATPPCTVLLSDGQDQATHTLSP